MATLEIEIKDDGTVGTLPEPLQKLMDARFNEAFGKGAEKAAKEAKAQIEDAVKKAREEERAAKGGNDPAATEKAKALEVEISKLREEEAKREKNFEEAQRLRDERYAKELAEREKKFEDERTDVKSALEKRDARLRQNVQTDIKSEAVRAGARSESIDEVCELLERYVGLDDDLLPVVKADAFRARFTESKLGEDGKPVSIEGLVEEYLSIKTHHRAAPQGRGGGAPGGRSLQGGPKSKTTELDGRLEAVKADPTMANVDNFVEEMLRAAR